MRRYKHIPSVYAAPYRRVELFQGVLVFGGWGQEWMTVADLTAARDRWVARSYAVAPPEAETDGIQCGSCYWYAALDGDDGLCANKDSEQDGRVVFEHGGCAKHSALAKP